MKNLYKIWLGLAFLVSLKAAYHGYTDPTLFRGSGSLNGATTLFILVFFASTVGVFILKILFLAWLTESPADAEARRIQAEEEEDLADYYHYYHSQKH